MLDGAEKCAPSRAPLRDTGDPYVTIQALRALSSKHPACEKLDQAWGRWAIRSRSSLVSYLAV